MAVVFVLGIVVMVVVFILGVVVMAVVFVLQASVLCTHPGSPGLVYCARYVITSCSLTMLL